ncbi:probable hydroxyethylthiazole kinase [Cephalotrichum gorgonifer]|uniref:Probable hydroxyethylthiazole kinase n=1 Tax=Cephalotrichum gorgonifer TaxID=2041049 RepID=A0AAE8SS67_9PEZI|nr:probable hydroxyethylthiazole kinase [Cephalotrichum gorgonifer]
MPKPTVDYSLYLVTDSTPAILGDRSLVTVVEAALQGGVTVVQYRDKTSDTGVLVSTARELHALTRRFGVPLLINDRVDVALAVGCEGVHIGQDDMDLPTARKLLGDDKIIGVSASTAEEALRACEQGADYLGIGAVFSTATKTNTKNILGPLGLRQILASLCRSSLPNAKAVKTVCIGGVNAHNLQRIIYQSTADATEDTRKSIDGVAIVSAIIGAKDPEKEAANLLQLVKSPPAFVVRGQGAKGAGVGEVKEILALGGDVISAVDSKTPLSHNMTNLVVQNFAANVALAVGASPIMANYGEEAADLAGLGGALVVNMGTVTPEGLDNYAKALKAYNLAGGPVVYDPVGAGATSIRRGAVRSIMNSGYLDVIKGNEGEILAVSSISQPSSSKLAQQRGVDSTATLSTEEKAAIVSSLARSERNIVVMTGKVDVVSDGTRTFAVENGHEMMGGVTGTGCVLGTMVSAFVAAYEGDRLAAVLTALVMFGIAGERAAAAVAGPGSFVPMFLDELYKLRRESAAGGVGWLEAARVTRVQG